MSEYQLTEKSILILKKEILIIINLRLKNKLQNYEIYLKSNHLQVIYNHQNYYITLLENINNHKLYYYIKSSKNILVLKSKYIDIVKILELISNIN